MRECVFATRGYRCVWWECEDCNWYSHSADEGWSKRAAEVHAESLQPGHHVAIKSNPHHDPERIPKGERREY